ncbi:MAG: hypothetical protein M0Q94_07210 [Candidatus Cloacimonetes bacterium]|nr:hypothetical protein [Candidatus Cloacimonadota bacterium]
MNVSIFCYPNIVTCTLMKSKNYLGDFFDEKKHKKGYCKGITTTTGKLAVIYYTMLKTKDPYNNLGKQYRAFNAEDLSRSDVSADAKKDFIGIGLKTFLRGNDKTFQKIAEFNADRKIYKDLSSYELVKKISELRNNRIDFTEKLHGLNQLIYQRKN